MKATPHNEVRVQPLQAQRPDWQVQHSSQLQRSQAGLKGGVAVTAG